MSKVTIKPAILLCYMVVYYKEMVNIYDEKLSIIIDPPYYLHTPSVLRSNEKDKNGRH